MRPVVICIAFLLILGTASALKCYFCDSATQPACLKPETKSIHYETCSKRVNSNEYCTKFNISTGNNPSVIVRKCVNVNKNVTDICKEIESQNRPNATLHCNVCRTDGCNTASNLATMSTFLFCIIAILVVKF